MQALLESIGLLSLQPALAAAGLTEPAALAEEQRAPGGMAAVQARLSQAGLKMGQRQKVMVALGKL